jgi:hypothetical protein
MSDDRRPSGTLRTLASVAQEYGVSTSTVRRWGERGAVQVLKIGGVVRVQVDPAPANRADATPAK